MPCQPIEHFALRFVGSQVPDERAFGRVFTQLLQMGLIILHRPLPVLIFHDGGTENRQTELTNVKSEPDVPNLPAHPRDNRSAPSVSVFRSLPTKPLPL